MSESQRILEPIDTDETADEQTIAIAALHAILGGEAIDRAGLVAATGFTPAKVDTLLDGQTKRGLMVVEPDGGRVVGSWGLSLVPTDHRLHIRKRELYTWCALDAVGIPAGLGEDASIASHCYHCGASVNVEMIAGQVTHAEPANVQIWIADKQVGRSIVSFT